MDAIRSEMHKIVQERVEAGKVTSLRELVDGVMSAHPNIEGDDAPFYRVHAFDDVSRIARRVIGKYAPSSSTPDHLLLPGFRYLCRAYSIPRDGDVVIVPVDQCTDAELTERAAQLDEMAKGCMVHAREIREYVLTRGREAA